MVRASLNTLYEYPLKIIQIDDFLLNSDGLLWKTVALNETGLAKLRIRIENNKRNSVMSRNCYVGENEPIEMCFNDNENDFGFEQAKLTIPRNLSASLDITILFIDSEIYRKSFEKSHLKLANNMIVMDR